MQFSVSSMHAANGISRFVSRAFPTPALLIPRAAGVDISDASIKWVHFEGQRGSLTVAEWGEIPLEEGIVVSGTVRDPAGLSRALFSVKERLPRVGAAHAALPEEPAFVFDMQVPRGSSRTEINTMIEFELGTRVPLPLKDAVYDFDRIHDAKPGENESIGVVVFPRDIVEQYAAAFHDAGLPLLSLELEARSVARAVVPERADEPVTMIVDFGGTRTGIAVVKHGIPIFTSTVAVGGESVSAALERETPLRGEKVLRWKNDLGLDAPTDDDLSRKAVEAISGVTSALGDEVARHFRYWDTRRDDAGERMTPLSRVYLTGGAANLRGLAAYLASRVQAPCELGRPWQRVLSFDAEIPEIDAHTALEYATAIGLALRSFI